MGFVFGPVASRRLGYSLGLDIVPEKYCTLNCLFCETGKTKTLTLKRRSFFPVREILAEFREALGGRRLDFITFSGAGEPTLNKDLGEIICGIRKITTIPICVLTNGTLLVSRRVRAEVGLADVVAPSLNAGSQEVFERIHRPHRGLTVERLAEGIRLLREETKARVWLEVMIVAGMNDDPAELARIRALAERIDPEKIQLNTVVRPPQDPAARPVSREDLERIRALFGPKAEVIASFEREARQDGAPDVLAAILELVKRRSVTARDIERAMGLSKKDARAALDRLVAENRVKKVVHGGVVFYREAY